MARFSGANSVAEKANENGFADWAVILIWALVIILLCFCACFDQYENNRRIRAQSALDQEAVSFITRENE